MNKYLGVLALVSPLIVAAPVYSVHAPAADTTQSAIHDNVQVPPALQHYLTVNNGKILDHLDGGGGLQGWYLTSDYGTEGLYTTADGTRLIGRAVFDAPHCGFCQELVQTLMINTNCNCA